MLPVIPIILGGAAAALAFLVSGCSKTEAPENKENKKEAKETPENKTEAPEKKTCIPSKYSDSYVKVEGGFKLSQGEAETICNIRKTKDVGNLEIQYYDCALRLHREGKYQPASSILISLSAHSKDYFLRKLAEKDRKEFSREALEAELFGRVEHHCFFDSVDTDYEFNYLRSLKNFTEPPPVTVKSKNNSRDDFFNPEF